MNRKSASLIALVLVLLMAISLLGACKSPEPSEPESEPQSSEEKSEGGESDVPEKPEKLVIWIQKLFLDDYNAALQSYFEEFGEKEGINVEAEIIDSAVIYDKSIAALEAGEQLNVTKMGLTLASNYIESDQLVDLSGLRTQLEEEDGVFIADAAWNGGNYNGFQAGIEMSAVSWLLWYRTDLIEKAGFDGPPETWEELLEQAKATTDPANGIYGAGFAAGAQASDFHNNMQCCLWSYGGGIYSDGEMIIDSPESQEALKLITRFFTDGSVAPDMVAGDDMANNTAMLSGTACFITNQATIASALQNDAPDLWEVTDCVSLPKGPEGQFSLTGQGGYVVINQDESQNYWTLQALRYVAQEARAGEACKMIAPAMASPYKSALEDTEYMSDPTIKALTDSISAGTMEWYPDESLTARRGALSGSTYYINSIITYQVVDGMSFDDALAKYVGICQDALDAWDAENA